MRFRLWHHLTSRRFSKSWQKKGGKHTHPPMITPTHTRALISYTCMLKKKLSLGPNRSGAWRNSKFPKILPVYLNRLTLILIILLMRPMSKISPFDYFIYNNSTLFPVCSYITTVLPSFQMIHLLAFYWRDNFVSFGLSSLKTTGQIGNVG